MSPDCRNICSPFSLLHTPNFRGGFFRYSVVLCRLLVCLSWPSVDFISLSIQELSLLAIPLIDTPLTEPRCCAQGWAGAKWERKAHTLAPRARSYSANTWFEPSHRNRHAPCGFFRGQIPKVRLLMQKQIFYMFKK